MAVTNPLDKPQYYNHLLELLDRTRAVEETACAPVGQPVVTVPYFVYTQPTYPYITHRFGNIVYTSPGVGLLNVTAPLIGRFVVGHLDAGYKGDNELMVAIYEPLISFAFSTNTWLTVDAEFEGRDFHDAFPALNAEGIIYTPTTGARFFDNTGTKLRNFPDQVAFEFTVEATFEFTVKRQYAIRRP